MATREAVATALLAKIVSVNYFAATGRRARDPSAVGPGQSPACFLVISGERIEKEPVGLPAKRTLTFTAFLYNDIGAQPNVFPETALNGAMEALESALSPDDFATGRCTLGGLVFAVLLRGEVKRAPAELTGKALALVPIDVVIP